MKSKSFIDKVIKLYKLYLGQSGRVMFNEAGDRISDYSLYHMTSPKAEAYTLLLTIHLTGSTSSDDVSFCINCPETDKFVYLIKKALGLTCINCCTNYFYKIPRAKCILFILLDHAIWRYHQNTFTHI